MSVRLKVALVVTCLWSTLSCAADNYLRNPAPIELVDELVAEEGFDREELLLVFASAQRQESILKAIARPAEKTKPWYEYREIFLNDKRESKAWSSIRSTVTPWSGPSGKPGCPPRLSSPLSGWKPTTAG